MLELGVEYVTGVGHGVASFFSGDHGDIIFQVGHYQPAEAAGKIIHFLSCQTARSLGRDFVANKCKAYFGYDEDFAFHMSEKDIFFECDSEIDRAFADGLEAQQVHARVKALFDRKIADLRTVGKLYAAATLEFDRDHLRCPSSGGSMWGDSSAKL